MSDGFHEQALKLELVERLSKRVFNDYFKIGVCFALTDCDLKENDLTTLTAREIIDKVRDVLAQNPSDANLMSFTYYLAKYPVSMCKRDVSPLLRQLIGFHYRLGFQAKRRGTTERKRLALRICPKFSVEAKLRLASVSTELKAIGRRLSVRQRSRSE